MKAALELHDSRVSQITLARRVMTLCFSHTYIHKSSGAPGKDPGTGWSQEAQLVLAEVQDFPSPPAIPNTISEGYLEVGAIRHELIPLPFRRRGRATLALVFADGGQFEIHGERPFIELLGSAKFLEDVP